MSARARPRAVVIGAGFGGLAAAIRLQARGWQVTLLERNSQPGGRAAVFRDKGFTYDAGPTIVTVPFVFEELWRAAGGNFSDDVRLVPCNPFYRIVFPDGKAFNYGGSAADVEAEVRRFNEADLEGYRAFARKTERIFHRAFTDLSDRPFTRLWDMVRVAPDLMRLRADQSVFRMVCSYIRDPYLRQVFSFNPLLIGGNPLRVSSIYSMIHHLEKTWGVHYVMGGTGVLVRAMVALFERIGGRIEMNCRVAEIECARLSREEQEARSGRIGEHAPGHGPSMPCVRAVRAQDGRRFEADVVVSNADHANTYRLLIDSRYRRKWTDARLKRMRYAMSTFLVYFGTNRTYPDLAHHTIVLGPRYEGLLGDIFDRKVVARDFSLYLHAPTRTDPSLAPPGHEGFYVLSPVPHLGGGQDWDAIKEEYADRIFASLEEKGLVPGLRKHLVSRLIFTPKDFETKLESYLGTAFQFEPVLTQSAWFRPHNVSEDIAGLFFAGAGTHPGAGLPGVLSSAKLLDRVIPSPEIT